MPNPTNSNEAEEAEQLTIWQNISLALDDLAKEIDRNGPSGKSTTECLDNLMGFILADRQAQKQKWIAEIMARAYHAEFCKRCGVTHD